MPISLSVTWAGLVSQELKISNGDIISLKELQNIYETGLPRQLLQ